MIAKKKLAKSKKKKLELVRDCMKFLQIVKEKKTFDDDLALEVKKLRGNYLEDDIEDNLHSKQIEDFKTEYIKNSNEVTEEEESRQELSCKQTC